MSSSLLFILPFFLIKKVASASDNATQKELSETPTWAVASVCGGIIIISILLETSLHKLGHWLSRKQKKALFEALEKVKAELMVLGFISLTLTFGQNYISKICVSSKLAGSMLPCLKESAGKVEENGRKLAGESVTQCKPGKEPLISVNGLHQIHILIFFLAVVHVLYSFSMMTLGRLKIRTWKEWEREAASHETAMVRLTHETSFVRSHSTVWAKLPIVFFIGCFFRQFYRSVTKADYFALRHGFITIHLAPGSKFDFQKYIKRSLQDDFKVVVGVSPLLWASFVVFLLLNVRGSHALLVASIIPFMIILVVGTKLMSILAKMAVEITERHSVVRGLPLVEASDEHFWFGWPHLLLHLIHFALFQNAFQITYFFWIWYSFGLKSCFITDIKLAALKLALGVIVLVLCSYITLPLYALVSQMGASLKKSVFDEHTTRALKRWHMGAKKKLGGRSPARTLDREAMTFSFPASQTIHRFNSIRTSDDSALAVDDDDDVEAAPPSTTVVVRDDRVD